MSTSSRSSATPTSGRSAARQFSNLDRDLLSVLNNTAGVGSLTPADNAGLGLARAVAVVSVLRQSPLLAGYKLIPLSGAQLVNTDETLAISDRPRMSRNDGASKSACASRFQAR